MAKAKSKSPHARLVQAFKKNHVGAWSRNAADLVARMDSTREGGTLDRAYGCPLLADTSLTIQESHRFRDIYQELYGEKTKPPLHPDIMALWERNPKYVELSLDAVYQFGFSPEKSSDGPLSDLDAFFPGCLLIDTSGIEWECEFFSCLISAVFVYPTYHEVEKLPMLRYAALGGNDARDYWFADLYLVGDTIGEARQYTADAAKRRLALQLGDPEEREAYEFLRDYIEVFDSTQEDLIELVDRILGLMLAGALVPEEAGFDGNVRRIRLISKHEAEEKAERQKIAEAFLAGEASAQGGAALGAASGPPHSENAEGEGSEGSNSGGAQGEPEDSALPKEVQFLKDALVQAGERYEQLRSRADADKAAFLHHVHELEARCRKLEDKNEALTKRAALIDEMELPKTPLDALRLAQKAYPDRLLFLDQATESAAEFDGRTANEVWMLLRSMATVLHPLMFGDESGDIAEIYQDKSGFELALRDVKQMKRNSKYMKKRTVRYEGKACDMSAHVKGRSNKPGEALRVHFFADHDRQLLVIGHCGDHLPAWW